MRSTILALVLCALTACGGSAPTSPTTVSFAGTFTLRTVNGQPLPFVALQSGQNSVTLISDQIIITDGGSWSESTSFRDVQNGVTSMQTSSDAGQWIRSGSSIALNSSNGNAPYTGTFTNTSLNVTDGSFAYVFTK